MNKNSGLRFILIPTWCGMFSAYFTEDMLERRLTMEKKVNSGWLFLVLLMVLMAIVLMMTYVNRSTDSYSGGILVENSEAVGRVCTVIFGGS
jgi:uncharacterized membrane protein (DUF485 family)